MHEQLSLASRVGRGSVVIAAAAIATLVVAALRCPTAFDYAESDVATWIWLLRHHHDIYRPIVGEPFVGSNYPPLQLGLVALLAPSDGTILLVGRLLSLAGILATSGIVAFTVGKLRASRAAGIGAALLFFATARAGYFAAVCRPDALALALDAAAVTLCAFRVRGWPLSSALLFAASLLCKHNLVAGPVGVALWAWRRDRPAARVFTPTLALTVAAVVCERGLVDPLLRWSMASFSMARLLRWQLYAVAPSLLGLLTTVRALRLALPARGSPLEVWMHVLAVSAVTTLMLGRAGSSGNYVLELVLALTVVGSTIAPASTGWRLHRMATVLECLAVVTYHLAVLLPRAVRESETARASMASARGPVFAETSWYATQSGHAPLTIPFLATQLADGAWSAAPLLRDVDRCDRLLVNFDLESPDAWRAHAERMVPAVIARLQAPGRYQLVAHVGQLYVYALHQPLVASTMGERR